MNIGILGKKLGMTQLFDEKGEFMPVTVIEAGPCTVLDVRGHKLLLGFGNKKEKNTPRPQTAMYKRINQKPKAVIKEMLFDTGTEYSIGHEITVDIFKEKDFVDVTGVSKGKGFQGGVKRWHWRGGPGGHGSMHHRRIGSIGGSSYPSRVWKGLKMPGRMGNERKTVQNMEIVKLDKDANLMVVKGCVPGANSGYLEIRIAKKKAVSRPKEETKEEKKKP